MKKLICTLLALTMALGLTACGKKDAATAQPDQTDTSVTETEPAGEWTREGDYQDEDENTLSIERRGDADESSWYVDATLGGDAYGNVLELVGGTLQGNLAPDSQSSEFTVTVSEEGADGLLLTTKDGESYHFTPKEEEPAIVVHFNKEGEGALAYVEGTEAPEIDRTRTLHSLQFNLESTKTYTFTAWVEDEGWTFTKWTKDGADFSTEATITVELSENADYVAVFSPIG